MQEMKKVVCPYQFFFKIPLGMNHSYEFLLGLTVGHARASPLEKSKKALWYRH